MKINIYLVGLSISFFSVVSFSLAMEKELSKQKKTSVSYIYYPNTGFGYSHAELEVNEESWSLLIPQQNGTYRKRSVESMIDKSTRDGYPFFRFKIKSTEEQVDGLKNDIAQTGMELSCSRATLRPLAKQKMLSVPFPVNVSPLWTTLYLTLGKKMKLNNVEDIEYYGNPSRVKSIAKMSVGTFQEVILGCWFLYILWGLAT